MTEKCYDIGAMQAFLDGELDSEKSELIACHISSCDECALMLAEAEEESAFAFSALEQEFNTLVPTNRLWAKINDSIEREKKSFWQPIFAFLFQPSTAAFAGLLFVFAVVIALVALKSDAPTNYVAENNKNPAINSTKSETESPITEPKSAPEIQKPENVSAIKVNRENIERRVVKSPNLKAEIKQKTENSSTESPENLNRAASEKVLGEESYIKTIATLTETVNNRKDTVLTPSARFAFEKDMALTNDAIIKMKAEVKQNPKDEAAKQILRASYQNKIDLLNSVADKTELMASLK